MRDGRIPAVWANPGAGDRLWVTDLEDAVDVVAEVANAEAGWVLVTAGEGPLAEVCFDVFEDTADFFLG